MREPDQGVGQAVGSDPFERERYGETLRALLMAPASRPAIYIGKLLGMVLMMLRRALECRRDAEQRALLIRVGDDLEANRQFADKLLARVKNVSGTSDLRIQQTFDQRKLHIDVDRTKAGAIGFTQREVATNLLVTLSGSSQTSPSFWLNPKNGVSYQIATQTPQYRVQSFQWTLRCERTCIHRHVRQRSLLLRPSGSVIPLSKCRSAMGSSDYCFSEWSVEVCS